MGVGRQAGLRSSPVEGARSLTCMRDQNGHVDWIVRLPDGTFCEPCADLAEVAEVIERNPGAGPTYRRDWTRITVVP